MSARHAGGGYGSAAPFRHEALIYAGDDGFLDGTVPFLEEALASGGMVMAALGTDKIDLLRDRLDGEAGRVHFADMRELGGNPGAIISAWRDFVVGGRGEGRLLWGIGEPVWPERSAEELGECHRHECLLNLAFADTPAFRLLCPYDAEALDPAVLEHAKVSHPVLVEHGVERASDRHDALDEELAALLGEPLPEPTVAATEIAFDAAALPGIRRAVRRDARDAGIDPERVEEVVLAVNEIASNSVRHAGGRGTLRLWHDDEGAVYEIRDSGRIADPLAGRLRPATTDEGGHGLWLVNQLCELVQVRSSDEGTVVRLSVRATR